MAKEIASQSLGGLGRDVDGADPVSVPVIQVDPHQQRRAGQLDVALPVSLDGGIRRTDQRDVGRPLVRRGHVGQLEEARDLVRGVEHDQQVDGLAFEGGGHAEAPVLLHHVLLPGFAEFLQGAVPGQHVLADPVGGVGGHRGPHVGREHVLVGGIVAGEEEHGEVAGGIRILSRGGRGDQGEQ